MDIIAEIGRRLLRTRTGLEENNLDALLLGNPKNVLYLTGRDAGRVLVTRDHAVLWVKELYQELYSRLYSHRDYGFEVRVYEKDAVKDFINRSMVERLGVENIRVMDYRKLSREVNAELLPCDIVERLRSVKSDYEITQLKKAAKIAKKGMEKAYDIVDEGISEVDAVAAIESEIRELGSETPPFESGMLLASSGSGADVHALAQMKKIRSGSLVVVDLGGRWKGYHSDMTRTLTVGRLGGEGKKLLEFVENLELETIEKLEVGVKASEIHELVEKKINGGGYRFYHSTGHGVGLEVHERPNIGSESDDILGDNMVFTIEPGIYIPKRFGIRFEDTVLLRKKKKEILTR
ncbi:MAG: aminopeptidase P family protein [Candidatus Altiarchaeota archaeon]|nr:aminopeptidase P family protein [Candidatus Altiarchaeota archaeon]